MALITMELLSVPNIPQFYWKAHFHGAPWASETLLGNILLEDTW